jgi:hypothetical protein
LAQEINSTKATAPSRTSTERLTSLTSTSRSGDMPIDIPLFSGCSRMMSSATRLRSADAVAAGVPDLSRPNMLRK